MINKVQKDKLQPVQPKIRIEAQSLYDLKLIPGNAPACFLPLAASYFAVLFLTLLLVIPNFFQKKLCSSDLKIISNISVF
ncbi:MAG: hypothetical protein ACLSB9_27865, partial [Hydrogeniiclostridium mannosilyticum]